MADSRLAVYASIAANAIIAATKLTAGALTGSSAMVAEGLHSLADTGDGSLLLFGHWRARRPADAQHPFGHGKELYFWSLMVAVLFFAVGGALSVYEGIHRLLHPQPLESALLNYAVLAFAACVDGTSFVIGVRQFRQRKGSRGYLAAIVASKDPTIFTVVLEDSGDLVGIALAFLGVFLSHALGTSLYDGLASIGVGCVLAVLALFLGNESRGLLVGEAAAPAVTRAIEDAVGSDPDVLRIAGVRTMQIGARRVLAMVRVELRAGMRTPEAEAALRRLERTVRQARPEVTELAIVPVPPERPGS